MGEPTPGQAETQETQDERYIARAVSELGLDESIVNDVKSARYAWGLNSKESNVAVARRVLDKSEASLSELARAMADSNDSTLKEIETDPEYDISAPYLGKVEGVEGPSEST